MQCKTGYKDPKESKSNVNNKWNRWREKKKWGKEKKMSIGTYALYHIPTGEPEKNDTMQTKVPLPNGQSIAL